MERESNVALALVVGLGAVLSVVCTGAAGQAHIATASDSTFWSKKRERRFSSPPPRTRPAAKDGGLAKQTEWAPQLDASNRSLSDTPIAVCAPVGTLKRTGSPVQLEESTRSCSTPPKVDPNDEEKVDPTPDGEMKRFLQDLRDDISAVHTTAEAAAEAASLAATIVKGDRGVAATPGTAHILVDEEERARASSLVKEQQYALECLQAEVTKMQEAMQVHEQSIAAASRAASLDSNAYTRPHEQSNARPRRQQPFPERWRTALYHHPQQHRQQSKQQSLALRQVDEQKKHNEWIEGYDAVRGKSFWYNRRTKETRWQRKQPEVSTEQDRRASEHGFKRFVDKNRAADRSSMRRAQNGARSAFASYDVDNGVVWSTAGSVAGRDKDSLYGAQRQQAMQAEDIAETDLNEDNAVAKDMHMLLWPHETPVFPSSEAHADSGGPPDPKSEQTQKDEEDSNWQNRHLSSSVKSWRFTPSPLHEEQYATSLPEVYDHATSYDTSSAIATSQTSTPLQHHDNHDAATRRHVAPISPIPIRLHTPSKAAPHRTPVGGDEPRQLRWRRTRVSGPSKDRKSITTRSSTGSANNSGQETIVVEPPDLSYRGGSTTRSPRLKFRKQQQQRSASPGAGGMYQSAGPTPKGRAPVPDHADTYRGPESDAALLEDVRQKWQFAHLQPSPNRVESISTNPNGSRRSDAFVGSGSSEFGARNADERRRVQRARESEDATMSQVPNRHWSEAPQWRP